MTPLVNLSLQHSLVIMQNLHLNFILTGAFQSMCLTTMSFSWLVAFYHYNMFLLDIRR